MARIAQTAGPPSVATTARIASIDDRRGDQPVSRWMRSVDMTGVTTAMSIHPGSVGCSRALYVRAASARTIGVGTGNQRRAPRAEPTASGPTTGRPQH